MNPEDDPIFEGDTGKWEVEGEEEIIWESPELHLILRLVGGSTVLTYFIIFFLSIYTNTTLLTFFAIYAFLPIMFVLSVIIVVYLNPQTGYLYHELKNLLPEKPTRTEITSEEIITIIKSEEVVSDWEIACELDSSISSVRSQLSQMESTGEICYKKVGVNSWVCWIPN